MLVKWNLIPQKSHREQIPRSHSPVQPWVSKASSTLSSLEDELLQLDEQAAAIQSRCASLQRQLDLPAGTKVRELEEKVVSLEIRCKYLEELKSARGDRKPYATAVAYLERIQSTQGLILVPCSGATMVYPLKQEDYTLLDVRNRTNLLSCATL